MPNFCDLCGQEVEIIYIDIKTGLELCIDCFEDLNDDDDDFDDE